MPTQLTITSRPGEVQTILLHLANATNQARRIFPQLSGPGAAAIDWRVVAYVLSKAHGWQPMPLLRRHSVTIPPLCSASLWITASPHELKPGRHEATLGLGEIRLPISLEITRAARAPLPVPLVGGWCSPYPTAASWRLFAAIGVNVIHGKMIPKEEMRDLGYRLSNVTFGKPDTPRKVAGIVAATQAMGLDYSDWSWEIFDEPGDRSAGKWATAARKLHEMDAAVRIWCNPGDANACKTAALLQMEADSNVFCPYINHFNHRNDGKHAETAARIGTVKLFYTTPCANEKAPNAPCDLLSMATQAMRLDRDGWDAFCLKNYYEYCNSPWDDVNAYHGDQAVSIYPGARGHAISTRNLEAVREAIQRWQHHQSDQTEATGKPQ